MEVLTGVLDLTYIITPSSVILHLLESQRSLKSKHTDALGTRVNQDILCFLNLNITRYTLKFQA